MRLRLIPRDESFFDLLLNLADQIVGAAEAYRGMLDDFTELPEKAKRLRAIEHDGDEITREVMRRLNTVFITPIDHEDIYRLTSLMDDVIDHIEAAGDLLVLHQIEAPLPEMKAQAEVLVVAAAATRDAIGTLPKYRELAPFWERIGKLEKEGDRIYRKAVADLFGGDHKAMSVLKWKDIIDEGEGAIDLLEDVADQLEAIALKQS